MSEKVNVGDKAPDFELVKPDGSLFRLKDQLKEKNVVLYFYPKDNTPGCTKQACAFRDASAELKQLGATVVGISADPVNSHAKFRDKYRLNFPLLADVGHAVSEQFGAFREKNMYGKKTMGIQRSTFLVDADGVITKVWRRVQVDGHDAQVIAALKAMSA